MKTIQLSRNSFVWNNKFNFPFKNPYFIDWEYWIESVNSYEYSLDDFGIITKRVRSTILLIEHKFISAN